MTRINRRTVLQPRCWVVHPFYSGVKLTSFPSVWSSLLDYMVACTSVGTIHFPFWQHGHEKNPGTPFYSLSRRFSAPQGWSQLSREPRYSAQSWAGSSSHMLPFHPKLAGNITLSLIVLLVCRFFYSVLFLHTRYYLLSIFQKLLQITVYWHKPTVFYLSVSVTRLLYFIHFSFFWWWWGKRGDLKPCSEPEVVSLHHTSLA